MDLNKLKVELKEAKEMFEAAEGADEKAFAKAEVDRLEVLIANAGQASKPAPPKKIAVKPKAKPAKKTTDPQPFEHEGKTYVFGVDNDYCDVLSRLWEERQHQAEKSQHKYKTKSLSLKIADGVMHPIKNVLNSIPATTINKDPRRTLVKLRKLKKSAKALLDDCKALVPELTEKDINGPIAVIEEMITEIEEKLK